MDYISLGYFGLFAASFLSATILPISSGGIPVLVLSSHYDPHSCFIVPTIHSSLGGLTNYGIGILGNPNWLKRLGIKKEKIYSFETRIKRHGYYLAFFSWVPFIGDPLNVALGFFRVPFWRVLLFLVLGKFLRYLALTVYYF